MMLVTALFFFSILFENGRSNIMKNFFKLLILLLLVRGYDARADYYTAKLKDKDIHLWLDNYESEGYLYFKGEAEVFKLNRVILDSQKQTSYEFNLVNEKKSVGVGKLDLKKKGQELVGSLKFSTQKKADVISFIQRKQSDILPFETTDMHVENDKCVFDILDLRSVRNEKVVNRILLLNQKVVGYYNDYGCEYLNQKESQPQKKSTEQNDIPVSSDSIEKAHLSCKSEIYLFKNRFYGINYFCQGSKNGVIKKKNFYQLYDIQLNIEVKKEDFTDSDVIEEDDNLGIMFGLSPVGLFLYYADAGERFETYQNHIPFYALKKNFEKWGKPKRYLRYFELK